MATDWQGDRADRVKHFPLVRRLLDRCVNAPVIRRLEKKLLASGHIISLSDYTAGVLADIVGLGFRKILLPVAVDSDLFVPHPASVIPGRLGFAGRFNDPRKNIDLFLAAVAHLRRSGHDVSVVLMGDAPKSAIVREVARLGLTDHVRFEPALSRTEMRNCLQTLDVFVLPSHQEGLCIAALEAMACGAPVVSTRCGGPQEFVIPEVNGYLVDSNAEAMASAIASIIGDRELRSSLSQAARVMAQDRYGSARVEAIFANEFSAAFPDLGARRAVPELKMTPIAVGDSIG